MGVSSKWMVRAEEYERILQEEGVFAAEKYLKRFLGPKIGKFLRALWQLRLEDERDGNLFGPGIENLKNLLARQKGAPV